MSTGFTENFSNLPPGCSDRDIPGNEPVPAWMRKRDRRDRNILASYEMFEESEPDISTERLLQQVADRDTGGNVDRVIAGLIRMGKFKKVRAATTPATDGAKGEGKA
jgi:hypothetical protein